MASEIASHRETQIKEVPMPKPRERDPNDKIKGLAGKPPQEEARRQMTAKLRKALAHRNQDGAEVSTEAQATDQTEQAAVGAVEEVAQSIHGAAEQSSHHKRPSEGMSGPGPDYRSGRTPAQTADPGLQQSRTSGTAVGPDANAAPDSAPVPQEHMKRKAVVERRRQQAHAERPAPSEGGPLTPSHYGNRPVTAEAEKKIRSSEHPSIKERPGRSLTPKEKPPGGAFVPKTRQSIESGGGKATGKAASAARQAVSQTSHRAKAAAQKGMAQQAKQAAKTTADFSRKAVVAVAKAVSAAVSALVSLVGGLVLVVALSVVLLVAALMASPFGILFSNEPSKDAIPLSAAVAQINIELADKLEALQSGGYDGVDVAGQPPDWREVAAVFAAKTAGAEVGVDVAALTPDRVERLRAVFWDMCSITTEVESIEHEDSTETILHITITARTADEMRTAYSFTDFQNQSLTELLAEQDALDQLLGDLTISQADALELLKALPADLSPERRAVVETACKLVGKLNYFWGGKSLTIGWDPRWGTLQMVTVPGNSTSGTYRPYGMDCSGFVDWVFYNISGGEYVLGHGGGAHAQHTYCDPISWDEALPGDLVFYPEDSHVGIVGGRDENGDLLIIHCAYSQNNVVITSAEGFTAIGRLRYYGE